MTTILRQRRAENNRQMLRVLVQVRICDAPHFPTQVIFTSLEAPESQANQSPAIQSRWPVKRHGVVQGFPNR